MSGVPTVSIAIDTSDPQVEFPLVELHNSPPIGALGVARNLFDASRSRGEKWAPHPRCGVGANCCYELSVSMHAPERL